MSATDAKPTHDVRVDALQRCGNRRVRVGQREEGLPAKPPKDMAGGCSTISTTSGIALK
jgi:hypothetical protein